MSKLSEQRERKKILKDAKALIRRHGWTAISVDDEAFFTYTVGLPQRFDHPELVVLALESELSQQLASAAVDLLRQGHRLPEGGYSDEVIEGFSVAFVPTSRLFAQKKMLLCRAIYGKVPKALHLIVPDKSGYFPWDQACEPTHRRLQWPLSDWLGWDSHGSPQHKH